MHRTIFKYPVSQLFDIDIPKDAEILVVQAQRGKPEMWVLLDSDASTIKRKFIMIGTGHPMKDTYNKESYIGTFQMFGGDLVFHLFEVEV